MFYGGGVRGQSGVNGLVDDKIENIKKGPRGGRVGWMEVLFRMEWL